jgi:PTH1 family peptidyl-tRNA hydrolase
MLVGLGNPGAEYRDTRHNVGFRVADLLLARGRGAWRKRLDRHEAVVYFDKALAAQRLLLLKPTTFMNLSGPPVKACMAIRGLIPADCLVVCDDMALPLGALRLRGKGSSGGHHGLDSLIAALGTPGFPRLRIGIGSPEGEKGEGRKGAAHVLGRFQAGERSQVEALILRAADAAEAWLSLGLERAQTLFNTPNVQRDA